MSGLRIVVSLFVMVFAVSTAMATDYGLPKKWRAKEDGSSENNPKVVDGKPQWRADGLLVADPMDLSGYKTGVWKATAKSWSADGATVVQLPPPAPTGSHAAAPFRRATNGAQRTGLIHEPSAAFSVWGD